MSNYFLLHKKLLVISIVTVVIISITTISLFFDNNSDRQQIRTQVFFQDEYEKQLLQQSNIKNPYAKDIISKCGTDGHCIVEELQFLTINDPDLDFSELILSVLGAFEEQQIWCHQQAHHIGKFLLSYNNGNVTKAFNYGSKLCGGAIYHGILENYFEKSVLLDNIKPDEIDVKNSCKIFEDDWEISLECSHGVGHGLASLYDFNLTKATNRCDEFEFDPQKFTCYRGVFMDNLNSFLEKKISSNFNSEDLFYPCNTFDGNYAKVCYTYQGVLINKLMKSTTAAIEQCMKLPEKEMIPYCYSGISVIANSPLTTTYNFVKACQQGNDDFSKQCFGMYAILITDWRGWDASIEFCKLSPEKYKRTCYEFLGKFAVDLGEITECSKAESNEYENICKNADPSYLRLLKT